MVYPVIVHTAYADARKRALGAAGGRGRGKRLAALPHVRLLEKHTAAYAG